MAQALRVEVRGAAAVAQSLGRVAAQVQTQVQRAGGLASGQLVAQDARARMPTRTGAMRGSVTIQAQGDGAQVREGGGGVPYMGWMEYGGNRRKRRARVRRVASYGGTGHLERAYAAEGRYLPIALEAKEGAVVQEYDRRLGSVCAGFSH